MHGIMTKILQLLFIVIIIQLEVHTGPINIQYRDILAPMKVKINQTILLAEC
jgi:hypothetical protein